MKMHGPKNKIHFNITLTSTSIFIASNLLKLYLKILYDILISLTLFILTSTNHLISNLYVRLASYRLETFKLSGVNFSSLNLYVSKEIYPFHDGTWRNKNQVLVSKNDLKYHCILYILVVAIHFLHRITN